MKVGHHFIGTAVKAILKEARTMWVCTSPGVLSLMTCRGQGHVSKVSAKAMAKEAALDSDVSVLIHLCTFLLTPPAATAICMLGDN